MKKATWNSTTIAQTEVFETVEGNVYFPPEAIDERFFEESAHTTVCGWKGTAKYYNVVVNGERNLNAAWTYPDPKPAASNIRGHVAFWKGVTVE